ncbi:MAG: hypothetical protein AAGB34_09530 [Planctomycetota bacterium]
MMFSFKGTPLFMLVFMLIASMLNAQDKPLTDAFANAPAEASAVIATDNMASLLDSAAVRALVAGIEKTEQTIPTATAWKLLSDRLGLDPKQTIEALASGRTTLVLRDNTWSIATQVSLETADMLRRNLDTAPRAQTDGLPVLGIEAGNFELILKPEGEGALAIIAPAGDRELITDLAHSADRDADHWAYAIELLEDIDALSANIVSIIKMPTGNTLAVTARFDEHKMNVRFRSSEARSDNAFDTPGILAVPGARGEHAVRAAWSKLKDLTHNNHPDVFIDITESDNVLQITLAARLGDSVTLESVDGEMSGVLNKLGHTGEGHTFQGRFPQAVRSVTDPGTISHPAVWAIRNGFLIVAGSEAGLRSAESKLPDLLPAPLAPDHRRRTVWIDLEALRTHHPFLFPMLSDILTHTSDLSWQTVTDEDGMLSGEATLTTAPPAVKK